jgi:hypothetical protein
MLGCTRIESELNALGDLAEQYTSGPSSTSPGDDDGVHRVDQREGSPILPSVRDSQ